MSRELGITPPNGGAVAQSRDRRGSEDRPDEPAFDRSVRARDGGVIALRRQRRVPLDDRRTATQPPIPLPDVGGDKPKRQKVTCYPISVFHFDMAEVLTAEDAVISRPVMAGFTSAR